MTAVRLYLRAMDSNTVVAEGPAKFEVGTLGISNPYIISLPAAATGVVERVELGRGPAEAPFAALSISSAFHVRLGDTVNFPPAGLRIGLESDKLSAIRLEPLLAPTRSADLAGLLAANPDATPEQIWDAAFMAGVEMTTTLLGGTRE